MQLESSSYGPFHHFSVSSPKMIAGRYMAVNPVMNELAQGVCGTLKGKSLGEDIIKQLPHDHQIITISNINK